MASKTMAKLPVIDLTKEYTKPGTNSWISIANDVRHALEEHGGFTAVYDGASLHNAIFKVSKELFDIPMETKLRNTRGKLGYDGYQGNFRSMPLFECLGFEDAATLEGTQSFTHQLWPQGNKNFSETALLYSKQLSKLSEMVMQMVFESYGIDQKYYESHIESTSYLMRFMKYRVRQENETNNALLPHTDKLFLAIIDQDGVEGLEIQTKDGEWIGIEPSPSTFVVVAGEPFVAWSNGRIYAPLHRVVMDRNEDRYSIALFSFTSEVVQTPKELVDDEHPLQFKPFIFSEFLRYCGKEGKNVKCPITTYCGV